MGKHDPDLHAQAVALLRSSTASYRDIAAQLDVPLSTLSRWAKAAGIDSPNAARTAAAVEATKVAWNQRRAALVDDLGEAVAELLQKARTANAREAQAFMTAVAIGVDKAQLLSGGVTSRHEQLDAQRRRERIAGLTDELEARRQAKDGTTGG